LGVEDLDAFYARRDALGITFTEAPRNVHGTPIARFKDSEGAEVSVSGLP
jgi:hypothetical protein